VPRPGADSAVGSIEAGSAGVEHHLVSHDR
jgi:hypothetical protein